MRLLETLGDLFVNSTSTRAQLVRLEDIDNPVFRQEAVWLTGAIRRLGRVAITQDEVDETFHRLSELSLNTGFDEEELIDVAVDEGVAYAVALFNLGRTRLLRAVDNAYVVKGEDENA